MPALRGMAHTGGGIISRRTFGYGYYEARLRIAAGSGWHSSFWMQRYNGIYKGRQSDAGDGRDREYVRRPLLLQHNPTSLGATAHCQGTQGHFHTRSVE